MAATPRPLTLGEILDRTVQLYRLNFLLFSGIAAAPAAINVLVSGSIGIFITSRAPALQAPATAGSQQALLEMGLSLLLLTVIGVPLLLCIFALAFGALNRTAYLRNRGEAATMRDAYGYSFKLFGRHLGIFSLQLLFAGVLPSVAAGGIFVVGVMLIALLSKSGMGKAVAMLLGVGIFLVVMAVIVLSVLVWIRFCLAFPVSVTEQIKAWPSLQRSNRLSKGTRGRIFLMYLLVAVLTMVVYYALTAPVDIVLKLTLYKSMAGLALISHPPLAMQIVNLFISFLERAFVMPIYAIALLLFYNDQRMRQEGYDIELLMDQAGWSHLTPIPSPTLPVVPSPPDSPTLYPATSAYSVSSALDMATKPVLEPAPEPPVAAPTTPPGIEGSHE